MQQGQRLESWPLPCIQTRSGACKAFNPVDPMAFMTEVRQSGQDADHSPPPSVKVKNARCHNFALPYVLPI